MSPASGAGAGGRRVTIRSMSCRGVKAFVPFQKPPLYATVSLGGRREKTPPDTDGGENPDWEGAVAAFDLDGDGREQLVQFEVKAQVPFLGNKLVGTASVPIADLAAGDGDGAALRHVSYQMRAPDGKSNGTLSFAYAITSGARPQPQLHTVSDGAPPEQGLGFCSAPPPPAVTAYPPPSTANFAPHGGGYPPPPSPPPPVSGSLYPSLQDLLPSSTYPPPASTLPYPAAMANPHFPEPNSSSYPPPPPAPDSVYPPSAPDSAYPPPTDSCTAYPTPPAHYTNSYPPQPGPLSSYPPPPPPSGYPPPASSLAPPTSTYPPPPQPESGSAYPVLPRSVDRELPYYPAPSSTYPAPPGGSYYPPPGLDDGAARTPYYYPAPGSRYP